MGYVVLFVLILFACFGIYLIDKYKIKTKVHYFTIICLILNYMSVADCNGDILPPAFLENTTTSLIDIISYCFGYFILGIISIILLLITFFINKNNNETIEK